MDDEELPGPGDVSTWRTDPLVVAARVDGGDDARLVLHRLRSEHPGTAFITLVSVGSLDDLGPVLRVLAAVMAERVFTADDAGSTVEPNAMAIAALEQHGVGQDFVFEVSPVARAVEYALRALAGELGWEGTALLVAGPARVLAQARPAASEGIPPATS